MTPVRLEPSVSSQALYYWATALPRVCGWCLLNLLKFLISHISYVLGTQESSRWNWPFEYPQHVLWFGKRKRDFASSTLILRLWLILFCLIWLFTSHQQSFSYKGTGLPGLNQNYARINVLAQGHNTVTPVRLKPSVLSQALYYWATALPRVCGWCLLNSLKFLVSLTSYVLGTQESSRWDWPFEYPQHVLWFGKRKRDFASSTLIWRLWL